MTDAAFEQLREALVSYKEIWWEQRGATNGRVRVWLLLSPELESGRSAE